MPSLRCPVCKAENTTGPACRRCRADLSPLFSLEEHREGLLSRAGELASQGRWRDFLALVEQAHRLRSDSRTRQLRAAGHLLCGELAQALRAARSAEVP